MGNNGRKVSMAESEHRQTTGDPDPVRVKIYVYNGQLAKGQSFKYLG